MVDVRGALTSELRLGRYDHVESQQGTLQVGHAGERAVF